MPVGISVDSLLNLAPDTDTFRNDVLQGLAR